jgi:hypothetical protein
MKINKFITISSRGSCRLTASSPRLEVDEISMNLKIEIPDAIFKKPRLEASITVPDEAAATEAMKSIVYDNVEEIVNQATGLNFSISVKKYDDE